MAVLRREVTPLLCETWGLSASSEGGFRARQLTHMEPSSGAWAHFETASSADGSRVLGCPPGPCVPSLLALLL